MAHAVLVIEDEAVLARNILIYLERCGYEVQLAASAEEGLEQLERLRPDVVVLDKAIDDMRRTSALHYYQKRDAEQALPDGLLGASAPMLALKRTIAQLIDAEAQMRDADAPAVLVLGETGTGKELVARALHFSGARRTQPFVELNA